MKYFRGKKEKDLDHSTITTSQASSECHEKVRKDYLVTLNAL